MAVEIEIDLDASGAAGQIAGIAAELEALEAAADDFSIDLESEVGKIGDQIRDAQAALEEINLDNKFDNFTSNLKRAARELDDAEIEIGVPGGSTGDGDSTGNDPPRTVNVNVASGFEDVARKVADGGDTTGSGSLRRSAIARTVEDLYDKDRGSISVIPGLDQRKMAEIASGVELAGSPAKNLGADVMPDNFFDFTGPTVMEDHDVLGKVPRSMVQKREAADLSSPDKGGGILSRLARMRKNNESAFGGDGLFSGIGSRLRKLKPTMGKYMQIFAALIPMAVALGVQLAGVASAMGAVGAAGAAFIGLGLIGHADSMAGAVANAESRVQDLKVALFEAIQPTARLFAPIQERAFDRIPQMVAQLNDELAGLTAFEDDLFGLTRPLVDGLEETLQFINDNDRAIGRMATSFATLIGSGAVEFFKFLISSATENIKLIRRLGSIFVNLAVIAYNVSMAIGRVVGAFTPLISVVASLSGFLNNKATAALLAFIATAGLTTFAVTKLGVAVMGLLSTLGILGSGSFVAAVVGGLQSIWVATTGLIAQFTALEGAALSAAAAIALTGVGALAVGAGAVVAGSVLSSQGGTGGGFGSGGSKTVYNDNRSYTINSGGNTDYATQKSIEDTIKRTNESNSAKKPPSVGGPSRTSDTPNNGS